MWRTVSNAVWLVALAALLGGCGLTQTLTDSSTSTARAIFYTQVKTLHLDFSGRAATNRDVTDMSDLSVPTMVRIYQLRERKAMERATYDDLLHSGNRVLGADLLDERAVVVKPGEGAQMSIPLDSGAAFVTVVALFRTPDSDQDTWRLTLSRNDLDPDRPRVIELSEDRLALRPRNREQTK
ncbi:type VI secretion system lipoprotein TssJ [Pseudomonas sp. BJa5]|uniref:type VI secretion system lipoprotein TssJ n=1 Tax=Pseudomonas sp. BJa5 TaxID=2936270 RepID=UPI002559B65C|nr:type VI secretion system lipoprotein TssJ [Pseudomonas sp. BGr12]MDL2423412.1 type VI secretion system lipoprotein TssJ [Pseudomonas sp. BGr12]